MAQARKKCVSKSRLSPTERLHFGTDAIFAIVKWSFALAARGATRHKDRAFQASSPKTFWAGLRIGPFFSVHVVVPDSRCRRANTIIWSGAAGKTGRARLRHGGSSRSCSRHMLSPFAGVAPRHNQHARPIPPVDANGCSLYGRSVARPAPVDAMTCLGPRRRQMPGGRVKTRSPSPGESVRRSPGRHNYSNTACAMGDADGIFPGLWGCAWFSTH
ncbi:hypothetical protein BH10PSE12_BH10PSE12_12540 [soil metagenome]